MSKPLESPLVRFLGFLVAVVIPILGYLAQSWRPIEVATAFLIHELTSLGSMALLLLHLLPMLGLGVFLLLRQGNQSSLQAINFLHSLARLRLLLIALAVVSLVATGVHLRMRYRQFSETSFQNAALAAVDAGEIRQARALCLRYLRLYPQRRGTSPSTIIPSRYDLTKTKPGICVSCRENGHPETRT